MFPKLGDVFTNHKVLRELKMIEKVVLNAAKHVVAIWAPDNFPLGCHVG